MDSCETIESEVQGEESATLFMRWIFSLVDLVLEKKPEPNDPQPVF